MVYPVLGHVLIYLQYGMDEVVYRLTPVKSLLSSQEVGSAIFLITVYHNHRSVQQGGQIEGQSSLSAAGRTAEMYGVPAFKVSMGPFNNSLQCRS